MTGQEHFSTDNNNLPSWTEIVALQIIQNQSQHQKQGHQDSPFFQNGNSNSIPMDHLHQYAPAKGSNHQNVDSIALPPPQNEMYHQVQAEEPLREAPFGLNLDKSSDYVSLLEKNLNHEQQQITGTKRKSRLVSYAASDRKLKSLTIPAQKLRALTIPATTLRIGSWEIVATEATDRMAKCYFNGKKLAWLTVEDGFKKKIEIRWSNIIGINASDPDVLNVELNQRSILFEDTNPEAEKQTLWKITTDFTRGQVLERRRHQNIYHPERLDKSYQLLLKCDERLYRLNRNPFPSLEISPFFSSYTQLSSVALSRLGNLNLVPVPNLPPKQTTSHNSIRVPNRPPHRTTPHNPPVQLPNLPQGQCGNNYNGLFDLAGKEEAEYDLSRLMNFDYTSQAANDHYIDDLLGSIDLREGFDEVYGIEMSSSIQPLRNFGDGGYMSQVVYGSVSRGDQLYNNQQQQQGFVLDITTGIVGNGNGQRMYQQQGFIPNHTTDMVGNGNSGEMYQRQGFVPDATTGMVADENNGEMYH